MSYFKSVAEHEALDGPEGQDYDHSYPRFDSKTQASSSQETGVEPPKVDETEQGVGEPGPEDFPNPPRSLSLATIASNAVHSAWEYGYQEGFNAGRLAGLDQAIEIVNRKPFTPKHPDDGNPF